MNKFLTHKIQYYPDKLAEILRGYIPNPVQCEITLTTACNYRCPWCVFAYMKHDNTRIDLDIMLKTINDFRILGMKSVVYAGSGEPFLYPDINKVLEETKRAGIKIGITTNGSMIKDEHIPAIVEYTDWIRFSIGAVSDGAFQECHGTNKNYTETIFSNIDKIRKAKGESKIQIGVQSVLTSDNWCEYIKTIQMCDDHEVDYYMLRPFYPNPNNDNVKYKLKASSVRLISDILRMIEPKHTKVFLREETVKIMGQRTYTICKALPLVFALEADGRVFNCFPERKDESDFSIGNVNTESLSFIWGGKKHREFLSDIMPKINKNECQPYCRHHAGNEYIQSLITDRDGIEFI